MTNNCSFYSTCTTPRVRNLVHKYLGEPEHGALSISLGSVCRRLPYFLIELGTATHQRWDVRFSYDNRMNKYVVEFKTDGPKGTSYTPFLHRRPGTGYLSFGLEYSMLRDSKVESAISKAIRERSICRKVEHYPTKVEFVSYYGKGIYEVEFDTDNLVEISFTPSRPTLIERIWMMLYHGSPDTKFKYLKILE